MLWKPRTRSYTKPPPGGLLEFSPWTQSSWQCFLLFSYLNIHIKNEHSLWFSWVILIVPMHADGATHLHLVMEPLTMTLWVWPRSQFLIQWVVHASNPCLSSLETRMLHGTVSKALHKAVYGQVHFQRNFKTRNWQGIIRCLPFLTQFLKSNHIPCSWHCWHCRTISTAVRRGCTLPTHPHIGISSAKFLKFQLKPDKTGYFLLLFILLNACWHLVPISNV